MAITVDPQTFIINVPRDDLDIVQLVPTEIRNMDLNWFKNSLGDLMDDEYGMPLQKMFTHNTEVILGGLTYARIVEILDPYTITFEDGQYAVNLIGANSNVADKTNVNQVSVRPQNSAGLISSADIEYGAFNGGVTYDEINGYPGTGQVSSGANIGTPRAPSNNAYDARHIALYRGFTTGYIIGDMTLPEYEKDGVTPFQIENFTFIGSGKETTQIFIPSAADVRTCKYYDSHVSGTLDGFNTLVDCFVDDLHYIKGFLDSCVLSPGIITLGGNDTAHFLDCFSGVPGTGTPTIDMGGSGQALAMRNYNGGIKLVNKNGTESVSIDLNSGQVKLDLQTVTNGTIVIRGIGKVIEATTGEDIPTGQYGDLFILNEAINRDNISSAVWDEPIADHLVAGTTGRSIGIQQFDGHIYVSTTGVSGTTFPIGTERVPVNNIPDALFISAQTGINDFLFLTDFHFTAGTFIQDKNIRGEGRNHTTLSFEDNTFSPECTMRECTVTGTPFGVLEFYNCIIDDYYSPANPPPVPITSDVIFDNCSFRNALDLPQYYTGTIRALDCKADGLENGDEAIININNASCGVVARNLAGHVEFKNNNNPDFVASIDMVSGNIVIQDTITEGNFTIRGVGDIQDNSGDNTIVDSEGLMSKIIMSEAVWDEPIANHLIAGTTGRSVGIAQFDGAVHIDTTGVSGTTFPIGTASVPVNNIADANTIAATNGLLLMHFHSDFTFVNGDYVSNKTLYGNGLQKTALTFEPGCIMLNCTLKNVTCTGYVIGATGFFDCLISDMGSATPVYTESTVIAKDCILQGTTTFPSLFGGNLEVLDCWGMPTSAGAPPTLDMGGGNFDVDFRNYSGYINLANCIADNNGKVPDIRIMINSGGAILGPSVTTGDFIINGVGTLEDNSTSWTSMDTSGLVGQDTVSEAVWDEPMENHQIFGTTGGSLVASQFGGYVHIGTEGVSGTDFPIGTDTIGVNNIWDALEIAENNDIEKLLIEGDFTIPSGADISGFTVKCNLADLLTLEEGCITQRTQFENARVEGTFGGQIRLYEGIIDYNGVSNYYGMMDTCTFNGPINLSTDNTHNAIFFDCMAGDASAPPVIDCGGDGAKISLRGITGACQFVNKTGDTQKAFIDLYSARVGFDSTITAGQFTVRGVGYIYQNDSTNTTFNTTGLMSKDTVGEAVWDEPIADHTLPDTTGHQLYHQAYDGVVHLDAVNGSSGITYPLGTAHSPVDNAYDALTIMRTHYIYTLHIIGEYTFPNDVDLSGITIAADRSLGNSTVIPSGAITSGTYFQDITVSGVMNGPVRYTTCVLGQIDNFDGGAKDSLLTGDITITGDGANYFTNCDTFVTDLIPVSISIGDSLLNVIRCRGAFNFPDYTGNAVVYMDFTGGNVTIGPGCVSGIIVVGGLAVLNDDSAVTCQVLDGTITQHGIANDVWEELLADHTVLGTYGNELATKADVQTSVQTTENFSVTGSAPSGNVIANDHYVTHVKDGVFWSIEEDPADGIVVLMDFNIPDDDKPGQLIVYGNYTGVPSPTHHIELWFFNWVSNMWERVNDEFMSGGIAAPDTWVEDYYERHIDRDNNNLVRLMLKHHELPSYNANHYIHLDSVELTSTQVVTNEDIAAAVWADPSATALIADVTFVKEMEGGRWHIDGNQMVFYANDNVTEIARFNLYDSTGTPNAETVYQRTRVT